MSFTINESLELNTMFEYGQNRAGNRRSRPRKREGESPKKCHKDLLMRYIPMDGVRLFQGILSIFIYIFVHKWYIHSGSLGKKFHKFRINLGF